MPSRIGEIGHWFYYPDSNTSVAGLDRAWRRNHFDLVMRYPGFHPDDWEGYQVRLDGGDVSVRTTSHAHYQWCKQESCENMWGRRTGWTRVSRGSHAGHIPLDREDVPRRPGPRYRGVHRPRYRYRIQLPGRDLRERTTTSEGLDLVPLETLDHRRYRRLDEDVAPPWEKSVYNDPESEDS